MVRPNKDKFEEVSYANVKGTEHRLVQVSLPFWLNVTFMDKYRNGTGIIQVCNYKRTKGEITKLLQKEECKVIKFEQFTTKLPNFCERCHRKGTQGERGKVNYSLRKKTPPPAKRLRLCVSRLF